IIQKRKVLIGRSYTPLVQLTPDIVQKPNDTLIDMTNTPLKSNSEALSGIQFGSFKLPLPTSTEHNIAQGMEKFALRGPKKGEDFDHDPEAEYERADCTTQ